MLVCDGLAIGQAILSQKRSDGPGLIDKPRWGEDMESEIPSQLDRGRMMPRQFEHKLPRHTRIHTNDPPPMLNILVATRHNLCGPA